LLRTPSTRKAGCFGGSSVKRGHDVLDLGVFLERVERHVLAVPALLVAAVRHLVDERDVSVDPDGAELQLARHPEGAAYIPGPDRGGEAVVHAVRPRERLL